MNRLILALTITATAIAGWLATPAGATPSSAFWTPATPYIQPYGVAHVTYDTYFQGGAAYPIDVGLQIGALPSKKIQLELGFDLLYPTFSSGEPMGFPVLLNAKLGAPEGAYFEGSPGWSAGIYGLGFEQDVTDYDVLDLVVGKTFPKIGSLAVGGFYGSNKNLFLSSTGDDQRAGFMGSWVSPSIAVPRVDHIQFVWDIQSGKSAAGATGGGVYLYLTPAIDILTGPVFFFDENLQPGQSSWMWSVQLDADIDLLHH